jgi:hypothetical protein
MLIKDIKAVASFYEKYINLNDANTAINTALNNSVDYLENKANWNRWETLGDTVYAPGKWTVKQVWQHIIDTERVFAYRALRIGRNDKTPLPGYDENEFAHNVSVNHKTLAQLKEEIILLRKTTILLYQSFAPEAYSYIGTMSNNPADVLAIGFTMLGHPLHHINVIEERYF